jgi:hypothetical protein
LIDVLFASLLQPLLDANHNDATLRSRALAAAAALQDALVDWLLKSSSFYLLAPPTLPLTPSSPPSILQELRRAFFLEGGGGFNALADDAPLEAERLALTNFVHNLPTAEATFLSVVASIRRFASDVILVKMQPPPLTAEDALEAIALRALSAERPPFSAAVLEAIFDNLVRGGGHISLMSVCGEGGCNGAEGLQRGRALAAPH